MRLLVTGACGRLGQAVAREAQERGIALVGVDRRGWPEGVEKPECLNLHQAEAEEEEVLDRLMAGCDGVIHTSGLHGGDVGRVGLEGFVRTNVAGVAGLLEKAKAHGVKGVALSSTMEVLIGRQGTASGLTVLDENSPIRADSVYSVSKRLMEEQARLCAGMLGVSVACLRFMAFGYKSEIVGGPVLLARVVHSRDAAWAAILAATTPGLEGEVFNIGPETPITRGDVAEVIEAPERVMERYFPGCMGVLQGMGMKVTAETLLPAAWTEKAKNRLGWRAERTFERWLSRQRDGGTF